MHAHSIMMYHTALPMLGMTLLCQHCHVLLAQGTGMHPRYSAGTVCWLQGGCANKTTRRIMPSQPRNTRDA